MPDITISTNDKPEEKPVQVTDVVEQLRKVDEYEKLKEANDKYEAELNRKRELEARAALGGNSFAGQVVQEKTEEEKAKEEAAELVKQFR